MTTAAEVVFVAALSVGVVADAQNDTTFSDWFQQHYPKEGVDYRGLNWCAIWVSFVLEHCGMDLKTAWVADFVAAFKAYGLLDMNPRAADVVLYDWSHTGNPEQFHVGIVESIDLDGTVHTIEGNTHPPGADSPTGVYRHSIGPNGDRDWTDVIGFGHPPYQAPQTIAPPPAPPPGPLVLPAGTLGVDCSNLISGPALFAAKRRFAMRYTSGIVIFNGARNPKIAQPSECADLIANSCGVGFVHEDGTLMTSGGATMGVKAALDAAFQMLVCGAPAGAGIVSFMACDTPTPPAGTKEFFQGAGPVLQQHGFGRGFYGNPDFGRMLLAAGLVDAIWAVETWGSRDLTSCAIVQRVGQTLTIDGVDCDTDELLGPAAGLWLPAARGWG